MHFVTGDASQPALRPAVIAHIVNDVGAWGAGFTASLDAHWPAARTGYKAWSQSGHMALGGVHVGVLAPGLFIAHLCAQRGLPSAERRRVVDYDALRASLRSFDAAAELIGVPAGASIHMPRIGTGFGGGRWAIVEGIVVAELSTYEVYVYDLPAAA